MAWTDDIKAQKKNLAKIKADEANRNAKAFAEFSSMIAQTLDELGAATFGHSWLFRIPKYKVKRCVFGLGWDLISKPKDWVGEPYPIFSVTFGQDEKTSRQYLYVGSPNLHLFETVIVEASKEQLRNAIRKVAVYLDGLY